MLSWSLMIGSPVNDRRDASNRNGGTGSQIQTLTFCQFEWVLHYFFVALDFTLCVVIDSDSRPTPCINFQNILFIMLTFSTIIGANGWMMTAWVVQLWATLTALWIKQDCICCQCVIIKDQKGRRAEFAVSFWSRVTMRSHSALKNSDWLEINHNITRLSGNMYVNTAHCMMIQSTWTSTDAKSSWEEAKWLLKAFIQRLWSVMATNLEPC